MLRSFCAGPSPRCIGLVALTFFSLAGAGVQAQWQSTNYALKGGWNSLFLHGDATHATLDQLFPNSGVTANVIEVWRWNPNPTQVQFTSTPLLPTPGTPEWSVWVRNGTANTLTEMTGQTGYLVRCVGTTANNYTITIPQRPVVPNNMWVRNGANFLGFPSFRNGSVYPTFSSYFATFPAAVAANTKIFKYVGGDLGPANPIQVFSPLSEPLDRNVAYWFSTEVVSNFEAPVEISFSSPQGLDFGRTGSIVTVRVLNRSAASMTLTVGTVVSNAAPAGQEAITGPVPLTRRTFDTGTGAFIETPIAAPYNEVIAPLTSIELSFGINRAAMGGSANALFASLLRLTDSGNLFEILVPARARQTTLAGLWVGEASVTGVESKPLADTVRPTGRSYPLRYVLHVADDGTARVLSQVFLGKLASAPNDFGLCTKEVGLLANTKDTATRIGAAHLPLDRVIAGSGTVALPGTLNATITIPFNDPANPFVHQYHPDHDNKDARGNPLVAGVESYTIERQLTFSFTASPPPGSTVTSGWGSSIIGGNYAETINGLHKDSVGVGSGDGLRVTGTFELRRVSELGTIIVNP